MCDAGRDWGEYDEREKEIPSYAERERERHAEGDLTFPISTSAAVA